MPRIAAQARVPAAVRFCVIPPRRPPALQLTMTRAQVRRMLKNHGGSECMVPIPATCIMFCCVDADNGEQVGGDSPEDTFRHLSDLFTKLDESVSKSGFFKYQHIGHQYIVTCPLAACPFASAKREGGGGDGESTGEKYPYEYLAGMVTLGLRMIATANRFFDALARHRGAGTRSPFYLRVGIAHGPAAGAVVGMIRAFYCIYGDTINTAARLCMMAKRSQIHCTSAFITQLGTSSRYQTQDTSGRAQAGDGVAEARQFAPSDLDMTPRGQLEVKGKGLLRTFDIHGWNREALSSALSWSRGGDDPPELQNLRSISQLSIPCTCEREGSGLTASVTRSCPSDNLNVSGDPFTALPAKLRMDAVAPAFSRTSKPAAGGRGSDMMMADLDPLEEQAPSRICMQMTEQFKLRDTWAGGMVFERVDVEDAFCRALATQYCGDCMQILLLHMAQVLNQYYVLVYWRPDLGSGPSELALVAGMDRCDGVLTRHLAVLLGLTLAVVLAVGYDLGMRRRESERDCVRTLLGLRFLSAATPAVLLGWLACCCYLSLQGRTYRDGWLVAWPAMCVTGHCLILPGPASSKLVMTSSMAALVWVFLVAKPHYVVAEVFKMLCITCAMAVAAVIFRHRREENRRRNWRLARVLLMESQAMRTLLRNLLPFDIAAAMWHRMLELTTSGVHAPEPQPNEQTAELSLQASTGGGSDEAVIAQGGRDHCAASDSAGVEGSFADKAKDFPSDSHSSGMTVVNPLLEISTRRQVICLQLDICDWTRLCSQTEPLALAELVHTLFCDFDMALSNTRYRFSLSVNAFRSMSVCINVSCISVLAIMGASVCPIDEQPLFSLRHKHFGIHVHQS